MSTHITKCIVCGSKVFCSANTHALGCGGSGCNIPQNENIIDFCSETCFRDLQKRMAERYIIYRDLA